MANMWMVRAGENAFLIDDFKDLNIVAIGWEVGDLSGKTSNEIKQIMENWYPQANKVSIGLNSGQVIRFVQDFEIGDYVISYNPHARNYLVGKITSDYYYSEKLSNKYNKEKEFYHHFRDVEWIGETNRDDLTQNTLKPLRSVMTIFNLNDSAKNEILTKIAGRQVYSSPTAMGVNNVGFAIKDDFAVQTASFEEIERRHVKHIQQFNEGKISLKCLNKSKKLLKKSNKIYGKLKDNQK